MPPSLKTPFWQSLHTRIVLLVLAGAIPSLIGLGVEQHRAYERHTASQAAGLRLQLARSLTHLEGVSMAAHTLLLAMTSSLVESAGKPGYCQHYVRSLQPVFAQYSVIGLADEHGNINCAATPEALGVNISDRQYFREAVRERRMVVSDLVAGRSNGIPTIVFAHPLLAEAGDQVRGVVLAGMKIDQLITPITKGVLPDDAVVLLFDRGGRLIYKIPSGQGLEGRMDPASPLVQSLLSQKKGVEVLMGLDGVTRLYAFAATGGPTDGALRLAVGVPEETFRSALLRDYWKSLAIAFSALLAALSLAVVGTEIGVMSRLRKMLAAAAQIGAGNLSARSGQIEAKGELGELSRGFDAMAESLQAREEAIGLAHEKLANNEIRLSFLLQESPAVIYTTGATPNYLATYISPNSRELLGFESDAFINDPSLWIRRVHTEDLQYVQSKIASLFSTGRWSGEYRWQLGDGSWCWLADECRMVKNTAEQPLEIIGYVVNATARKEKEETIAFLVNHDALTGLPNRTRLLDRLKQAMAASARNRTLGALLLIDLDNFKTLNDTRGHDMGDVLLKQVGQRLSTCVR